MNSWIVLGTVVCKVSVDLPSFAPIKGLLDVHGGRSEGLEGDDDVGDMELGLQVQLDGDCLIAIGGLPPGHALLCPGGHRGVPPVDNVGHIVSQVLKKYILLKQFLILHIMSLPPDPQHRSSSTFP